MHTQANEEDTATTVTTAALSSSKSSERNPSHRTGRWTLDEKILFLYGLQKFGKGRWKKMSVYLPNRYVTIGSSLKRNGLEYVCTFAAITKTPHAHFFIFFLRHRSLVQIKSHAQKVLKRIDAGENVFRRLHDNTTRMEALVAHIHNKLGLETPALLNPMPTLQGSQHFLLHHQQQQQQQHHQQQTRPLQPTPKPEQDGAEHIIAASTLCQLAGPSPPGSVAGSATSTDAPPSKKAVVADAAPSAALPQWILP